MHQNFLEDLEYCLSQLDRKAGSRAALAAVYRAALEQAGPMVNGKQLFDTIAAALALNRIEWYAVRFLMVTKTTAAKLAGGSPGALNAHIREKRLKVYNVDGGPLVFALDALSIPEPEPKAVKVAKVAPAKRKPIRQVEKEADGRETITFI
jgi:hypothetical protein